LDIPIYVAYVSNVQNNLPGLATVTVAGAFAPFSSTMSADLNASIPRFGDLSSSVFNAFSILPCCASPRTLSAIFAAPGGPGTVSVVASNTCSWKAYSETDWVTVESLGTSIG